MFTRKPATGSGREPGCSSFTGGTAAKSSKGSDAETAAKARTGRQPAAKAQCRA